MARKRMGIVREREQTGRVQEWKDDILNCRDLGHAWEVTKYVPIGEGSKRIIERQRHCLRPCGTTKFEWLNVGGDRVRNPRYFYAPGYIARGSRGHIPPYLVRREVIDRALKLLGQRGRRVSVRKAG